MVKLSLFRAKNDPFRTYLTLYSYHSTIDNWYQTCGARCSTAWLSRYSFRHYPISMGLAPSLLSLQIPTPTSLPTSNLPLSILNTFPCGKIISKAANDSNKKGSVLSNNCNLSAVYFMLYVKIQAILANQPIYKNLLILSVTSPTHN